MQYSDLVSALGYWCQQEQPNASFTAATPTMISAAELRIYRDLDLAAATGQNLSLQTTAGQGTINMTALTGQTVADGTVLFEQLPVSVEGISALVGTRWIAFQAVSLAFLQMAWPDLTMFAPPEIGQSFYTMLDDRNALLAPVPDLAYPLRVTGLWRPASMTAANPATWLGTNMPDLLLAAVMIEAMAYQRDFGAMSDNPQAALSWEAKYEAHLRGAKHEEALRKGLSTDPPALAMPMPGAPPGA